MSFWAACSLSASANERWSSNIALHYTWGRGYYEQYEEDQDFEDYGDWPSNVKFMVLNIDKIIQKANDLTSLKSTCG